MEKKPYVRPEIHMFIEDQDPLLTYSAITIDLDEGENLGGNYTPFSNAKPATGLWDDDSETYDCDIFKDFE